MPRSWTEDQKKAFGEKMRALRAAKKVAPAVEVDAQLNPVADDIVVAPIPRVRKVKAPAVGPVLEKAFTPTDLIYQLEHIPLDTVTYPDCGLLLNALSAASTAVALARRQRQEQMEAGTHRAACKTCGRMIDISKSGGFQILTERDEHHMPQNVYFCSQNCLLAKNMPSHARQTPRQKVENRP
jgi:hypothetical protein